MNSARRVYFSSVAANVTSPSRNGLSRCERIFFHLSFSFSSVLFDSFTVLLLLASDLNNDGVGQPDVDLASYACTVHKWAKVSERSLLQLVLPDAKMVEKKQTSHKTTRDNMSKNIISSLDPFGEIFLFSPFRLSLASFSSLKVIFASFWLSVCYRCRVCSICFFFLLLLLVCISFVSLLRSLVAIERWRRARDAVNAALMAGHCRRNSWVHTLRQQQQAPDRVSNNYNTFLSLVSHLFPTARP